jgi:hypothetical protein
MRYNASYINALSEERDPKILFDWIIKLHRENVDLRENLRQVQKELKGAYESTRSL